MKVELIDSTGKSSLEDEYRVMLRSSSSFDIATAFIADAAIKLLEQSFIKNRQLKGRLITGLYNCFNSQAALLQLVSLSKRFGNRLSVKISKEPRFHWKYYHFNKTSISYVYIGSGNFTSSGMNETGELQTKITVSKRDKAFKEQCNDRFVQAWENAVHIEEIPWSKYKSLVVPKAYQLKLDKSISDILFLKNKEINVKQCLPIRLVKTYGSLTNKTEKVINSNKSNWGKKNWDYFSCTSKQSYNLFERNQSHFLISKKGNDYSFHSIMIKDKDRIITEEGNYFVAYDEMKKFRPETPRMIALMNELGIVYRTNKKIDKKLTLKQSAAIGKYFGI